MKLEIKRNFEYSYRLLNVEITEGGGWTEKSKSFESLHEAILYMETNELSEDTGDYIIVDVKEVQINDTKGVK